MLREVTTLNWLAMGSSLGFHYQQLEKVNNKTKHNTFHKWFKKAKN
jgi:hypothetical protein